MSPIVVNEFGETLVDYPQTTVNDNERLSTCFALHETCNGFVDLKRISKTHNCILCRACSLRIVIPQEIDTYGKLRQWCAQFIERRRRLASKIENAGEPPRWVSPSVFND